MAFASRFLNSTEERYSVNELEVNRVVWSIDYFQILSLQKGLHCNNRPGSFTINPKGTSIKKNHIRRIDSRLLYNLTIEHMPGAKMGPSVNLTDFFLPKLRNFHLTMGIFVVAMISNIRFFLNTLFNINHSHYKN